MKGRKIKKLNIFVLILVFLPVLYSCEFSESHRGSASSDELASFALKAINARSGDFEAVDREFELLDDFDKLEVLDIIYVNKTVDEDSRFSRERRANQSMILALKEESYRLFGDKFIGDLSDEELGLAYSRIAPTLKADVGNMLNRSACQYHVYQQSVRMNNSASIGGSKPVSFRRTVNTPDEYPCDFEVVFSFEPRWIGTDFWPTYRLLKSFGGGVISDQNRVLFGALRSYIWYNTASESAVERYFAKSLYVVD